MVMTRAVSTIALAIARTRHHDFGQDLLMRDLSSAGQAALTVTSIRLPRVTTARSRRA
jgi:hypothetical protein